MIRVLHSEQQHSQLSAVLLWLFYSQLKETQTSKSHNNIRRLHSDAHGAQRFLINRVLVPTCSKWRGVFFSKRSSESRQMVCDGVRRGIAREGRTFHFGFASPKSAHRLQLPQGRDPTNRSFHHITVTDSQSQTQKFGEQMSEPVVY